MSAALSHIRVLDLSRVLAGPWASQTLADLGAEVIKIERPGTGDDTRGWGPPYLKDDAGNDTKEAAYFLAANRGKKSLTVNLSKPEGQALIRRLAAESDVFIKNYKVGDMARYGLSYDDLKKINAHANIVPYQVFKSQDGHVVLAVGNDGQFMKFCEIAGCPELAKDERFATNAERVRNRETLIPMLQEILQTRRTEQWIAPLESAGVPCGPINNIAQAFESPQVRHRKMKIDLPHPLSGTVPSVANPIRFSATPISYQGAPPLLGQHTHDVLTTLGGLSESEIEALKTAGVI